MKLHVLSDLHMEFSQFDPPATDAGVVVLAGDIHKGDKGVFWARQTFPDKPILFVPGNHEFYGTRRTETLRLLRVAGQQTGVQILDEDEIVLDGVRFLGCTLWTDFLLFGEAKKSTAMSDGKLCLTEAALAVRLKEWVDSLGDREVIFRSDNPGLDWPWVEQLFTFYGCWPKNMRRKFGTIYFNHDYQINRYQDALAEYWKEHSARQHHALIDARSLLYGWRKAIKRGI